MERIETLVKQDKTQSVIHFPEIDDVEVPTGEAINYCFVPAYLDTKTNHVHIAMLSDGEVAPVHVFAQLPEELLERDPFNKEIIGVTERVQVGYVLKDQFYTQEQAIALMELDAS